MNKISKILFPTDFSEAAINAFRYALWFARKCNADIEVWHFVGPQIEPMDFPVLSGNVTAKKVEVAKEVMQTFIKTVSTKVKKVHNLKKLPKIKSHVELGVSAKYISDKVTDEDIDMIIMGTQGEHNTLERIFGSVSSETIRKAECPVLVVPSNFNHDSISTVLFATELHDSDPYHIWETINILHPFKPEIQVVNILEENREKDDMTIDDLQQFFKDNDAHKNISFHSLIGDDKIEVLHQFSENNKADLLVMYKPKYNFFERLFHSSLTKEIAMKMEVPLLVVK